MMPSKDDIPQSSVSSNLLDFVDIVFNAHVAKGQLSMEIGVNVTLHGNMFY